MNYRETVASARQSMSFETGGSDPHDRLLSLVRRLKKSASDAMADKIEDMKQADKIYHAFRVPDDEDKKAAERGEPIKIIYPVTYAQIQTMLAALATIFDKKPFYELDGRQPQSHKNAKVVELELDYQLEQASFTLMLYQWTQDMLKYGFGAIFPGWRKEESYVTKRGLIPALGAMFGIDPTEKIVGFEGCSLEVADPYEFLFDPSVSVGNIQRGQFVIQRWKRSYNELLMMQDQSQENPDAEQYFNVDKIPERQTSFLDKSKGRERDSLSEDAKNAIIHGKADVKGSDMVRLDSVFVKLVPKDYELAELSRLQIWKITLANDSTIIQAEPSRFEHGQFPVAIIEYNPDQHELVNDGLAQVIDGMQNYLNWLLNTNMTNVRKVINDVLIVDPAAFDINDLNERKSILKLKSTAKLGIDRYIKQLDVRDVTAGHIGNSEFIFNFIQKTTGLNDNTMGQQTGTVRTATENANINRLAAGRITLLAKLMWDQGLRPLGKQLIQNTQQFSSGERLMKVTGGFAESVGMVPQLLEPGLLKVGPANLQGFFSIAMLEASTPSDKMVMASQLKEIVMAMMQSPQAMMLAQAVGINIPQVLVQMLQGMGIRNTTDLMRPPPPDVQAQMMQIMQMMMGGQGEGKNGGARGVNVTVGGDEQVMRAAEQGRIQPI